ncbi:MAG: oligopeptide transporter, OPT family [Acidobacteria bacterium]|nr:oligopeptide transporter, OPT family [Acidobacteriota bacterium]
MPEHKPFVPPESTEREFTLKALLAGLLMAALFGAANAYLGMKAGQTVAATIPAAVIAIALFRLPFFRGGVLEQNLTRTAASVGEALVAGAVFTIPAFMMVNVGGQHLWADLRSHYWAGVLILLVGGLLGVFFIIILRRPLTVESDLPFPESTASAEIVKAGQQTTSDAPKFIFGALGLGALLQLLKDAKGFQVFHETTGYFLGFPRAVISYLDPNRQSMGDVAYTGGITYTTPSASPALIGIGFIIGPRLASINFSGGVIAWLVLIPLVLFIDPDLPARLGGTAAGVPAWDVLSDVVWRNVVRPIAVGAMLMGAAYTLYGMRESIMRSVRGAVQASASAGASTVRTRVDIDIPIKWIALSIVGLTIPITIIYQHFAGSWVPAIIAALVMTVIGFFLAAVGGYLVGLVGSTNQPVSGLTLAALIIAALVMVGMGVKGLGGVAAVLGVASVVCCACCVSGSLIQDLKAGYLLGGTPWKMELVEVISVTVLSFFLLVPIILLHEANLASGGIGGRDFPAPQAGLMAQLAQGFVGGQMPWGLLLMGILFGVALIMIKAPSPMLIAVGMYLPLETTSAIFVGGVIKWTADALARRRKLSAEEQTQVDERGTFLASGLIAGEAIAGILLPVFFLSGIPSLTKVFTGLDELPFLAEGGGWISLLAFAVLAYVLIWLPQRRVGTAHPTP